jgi:hypothetical protein
MYGPNSVDLIRVIHEEMERSNAKFTVRMESSPPAGRTPPSNRFAALRRVAESIAIRLKGAERVPAADRVA